MGSYDHKAVSYQWPDAGVVLRGMRNGEAPKWLKICLFGLHSPGSGAMGAESRKGQLARCEPTGRQEFPDRGGRTGSFPPRDYERRAGTRRAGRLEG